MGASRGLAGVDLGRELAQNATISRATTVGWSGGGRWRSGRGCGVDQTPREEAAEEVWGCGSESGTRRSRSGPRTGPEMRQLAGRWRRMVGRRPLVQRTRLRRRSGQRWRRCGRGFSSGGGKKRHAELWLVVAWVLGGSACVRVVMVENGESCPA